MLETTQEIITAFELYTSGSLSISSQEELDLAQSKYDDILEEHEWEFLKKSSPVLQFDTNSQSLAGIDDFNRFTRKGLMSVANDLSTQMGSPYYIIPFEDRRMYTNQNGYLYYDAAQDALMLTKVPDTAYQYSLDYIFNPPALDLDGSNPIFPKRYRKAIYFAMLLDNDIIELSDKARSYRDQNLAEYEKTVTNMKNWNDKLTNQLTYGI